MDDPMLKGGKNLHRYLSTGCYHGDHTYCQATTGQHGDKRPGRCKFCAAKCVCSCHDAGTGPTAEWFEALSSLSDALAGLGEALATKMKPKRP